MKAKLKNQVVVDVIPHPEYHWLLNTQDVEQLLGIGRSVICANKRNNPNRYTYGVDYMKAANMFSYILNYDDFEFVLDERRNLWTRKGILNLSQWVRNVRFDFQELLNQLDRVLTDKKT